MLFWNKGQYKINVWWDMNYSVGYKEDTVPNAIIPSVGALSKDGNIHCFDPRPSVSLSAPITYIAVVHLLLLVTEGGWKDNPLDKHEIIWENEEIWQNISNLI